MRLGAGLEAGQPNVRLERGGGRYRPTVRGAHAVGGCGRGTRIVEQHGMHLDHVQRRTGGVLEVLLEDRQVDAAVDDQLGLLEYFAAGGLDRLLAGLDASAREGPATERRCLRAFDPHVACRTAKNAECDARGRHEAHRSGPRSRW